MTTLLDRLRGTLAEALGAADHLAWYVEWQAGGRRCARALAECGDEPAASALATRAA
jgi:hypothetical protein